MSASPLSLLLRTLQLGDGTFPVGAFTFSNGLESALQTGVVSDAASLKRFVQGVAWQSAGLDGVALLHAHRAARAADLRQLLVVDEALMIRRVGQEQRLMLTRMGKKLTELGERLAPGALPAQWLQCIRDGSTPGSYPVSAGLLFASLEVAEAEAFAVHHYGVVSMMLGAALRLMKIDHYTTQQIAFELHGDIDEIYQQKANCALEDMASFSPVFDVLVAQHEQATVRMFMN